MPATELPVSDSIAFVSFDNLSNIYLISNDSKLYRQNPGTKQLYSYQNTRLGSIGSIDVTDPFKILVFYPLFQTIITLDNTLTQIGKLDFHDNTIGTIRSISRSTDNNIWIYDESNRLIDKISTGGKILIKGIPNYDLKLTPLATAQLFQDNNLLFLTQTGKPVYVFDQFGKFDHQIILPTDAKFIHIHDFIYYISDGDLRRYDYTKPALMADEVIIKGINSKENFSLDFSKNKIYKIDNNNNLSYLQF
jgi:hypothetical protein